MRVRTLLARAIGLFPLTPTGIVALCASLGALVPFGFWRSDRVLLVAGTAGLLLIAGALALTVAGALWLRVALARTGPPTELRVGNPGRTGFRVVLPWALPLLDVRWTVTDPDGRVALIRRGRETIEQLTPRRRGKHDAIGRWFEIGDVFGLAGIAFPADERRGLRVLPDDGALRQVDVVRGLASGDQFAHPDGRPEGDLMDLRGYGQGDPIRYVLWKVFARTRDLVVRTPERALAPVTRTIAYLIAGEHDEAAAGTAKTAIECGALGAEWLFGADGVPDVARDKRAALEVVLGSGRATPKDAGAGLGAFLARQEAERPRRIVVFAPAVPGPWLAHVREVAQRVRVELVLCADRVVPDGGRTALDRLVRLPADEERPGDVVVGRDALARLCRSLAGVGDVRVVDRRSGRVFGEAHLARLTGAA